MKIAVPVANGTLCMHFGHAPQFAILTVDDATKKVTSNEILEAPEHEPGLLPRWLGEKGVTAIIAGGMGSRAQGLFGERGIAVVTGAAVGTPDEVVRDYLAGTLQCGENACDH
jgi:predicted Fe-Mo cluster-binding NifX family protein